MEKRKGRGYKKSQNRNKIKQRARKCKINYRNMSKGSNKGRQKAKTREKRIKNSKKIKNLKIIKRYQIAELRTAGKFRIN